MDGTVTSGIDLAAGATLTLERSRLQGLPGTALVLAGHAIAALIVLRSGDTAWCWKIAYDERHARASPGVQLMLHATSALLADPSLAQVDSCAAPDHPMIDQIWRERLALADRLVRPGPSGRALFAVTRTLETMRRGAITAAKRARDLIRRRRHSRIWPSTLATSSCCEVRPSSRQPLTSPTSSRTTTSSPAIG